MPQRTSYLVAFLMGLQAVLGPACITEESTDTSTVWNSSVIGISKWQPVFLKDGKLRFSVTLDKSEEVVTGLVLFVYLSDKTRFRGNQWVLFQRPLSEMGLTQGKNTREFEVNLPPGLAAGSYYLYATLTNEARLEPQKVVSTRGTKLAIVSCELGEFDLAEVIAPAFLNPDGKPDVSRIRANVAKRKETISALLYDTDPDDVANPVELAEAFINSRRYQLEHTTAEYSPGPAFWKERPHPSDSLEAHGLRMVQILALAFDRTGNRNYLRAAGELYTDWRTHNRINSFSSRYAWNDHSAAIRLQSIVMLAVRLSDQPGHENLYSLILEDLYRHCQILNTWGFYSSWSNHGLFQNHALLAAAVLCDVFIATPDWQETALKRTATWLSDKVYDDGALNEGSTNYQFIVLKLALRISQLGKHTKVSTPGLEDRIRRMVAFALYLIKPGGGNVAFGDSGVWLKPPECSILRIQPAKGLCRRLQEDRQPWSSTGVFSESGYFFHVADHPGTRNDLYLAFDFGTSTTTTHFQDDTMNFELMLLGKNVIQDSGLLDYSRAPINDYYRSPRAHSTAIFNDNPSNPYAMRDIQATRLERFITGEGYFEVSASLSARDGSWWSRSLRCYSSDSVLVLRDVFTTTNKSGATFFFHYAPEIEASLSENRVELKYPSAHLVHHYLSLNTVEKSLSKGQVNPAFLGWISTASQKKEPRWTASFHIPASSGKLTSVFAPAGVDITPFVSGMKP